MISHVRPQCPIATIVLRNLISKDGLPVAVLKALQYHPPDR